MILDGHVHIGEGPVEPELFAERLSKAGIDGGLIISLPPVSMTPGKAAIRPS